MSAAQVATDRWEQGGMPVALVVPVRPQVPAVRSTSEAWWARETVIFPIRVPLEVLSQLRAAVVVPGGMGLRVVPEVLEVVAMVSAALEEPAER